MTPARALPTPRTMRRLAIVAAAALLLAVLPLADDEAQADYEVTPFPGAPGSIVERTGDDLIPSYRYRGASRFDTAHLIAEDTDTIQSEDPESLAASDTVILARADLFPDALAGAFLAGLETAPILLVSSSGPIDPHTREALDTIGPDNVILLGGTAAIGSEVEDDLDDDYEVERVFGSTRFGTAAAIAMRTDDSLPDDDIRTAIVASGEEFPDALVSGSVSYAAGLPLLLTPDAFLHPVVADALEDLEIDEVLLMGGNGRLQADVQDAIEALDIDVRRVFGRTRVGTAAALADLAVDRYGFSTTHVNFARGDAFPDALTMGPHAGEERAALLLTVDADRADDGQSSNAGFMEDSGCVRNLHIAGGVEAISHDTEQALRTAATQPGVCFTLAPSDSTNLVGESHTVTATLTEDGLPIGGSVSFTVEADDDSDAVPDPDAAAEVALEDGSATFSFTSLTPGSVTITACVDDADDDLCATASKRFNTDAFVEAVNVDTLMGHLAALQACADDNGDTRADSTPGYDCSVEYITQTLMDAGYDEDAIERIFFDFVIWEEEAPGVLNLVDAGETYGTDDENSPIDYMSFSGSESGTTVTGPLAEPLGNIVPMDPNAPPSTSDAGCDAADFAAFPAGAIAVIQRGTCDFRVKAENAADAGAVGVIIFNEGQTGRQELLLGTLSYTYADREVPVFGTTYAFGADLVENHMGEDASMATDTFFQDEVGSNVILSIPGSDPQGAFMSGSHLDSVPEGPGINDNGSGSVGILEIAVQMAEQGVTPRNDTYFAWWGAEEFGLIGSTCFVSGDCGRDLDAGRVVDFTLPVPDYTDLGYALLEGGYLNYDMIGSPNFMRGIYDGDGSEFGDVGPPGSDSIEATFQNFFDRFGMPHQPSDFSGRSDYVEFTNYGIAAGGLFTGAEQPKTQAEQALYGGVAGLAYDPCYHQACDNMTNGWTPPGAPDGPNINLEAIQTNAWATANSALLYAMSLDSLSDPGGTGGFSAQALQAQPGPDTINGLAVR